MSPHQPEAAPPAPADPELLRRHLAGDLAAFELLYDRHERRCFDFIRRMLAGSSDHDAAAAEDVHQEVWIAVARQGSGYDPGKARFVTWLFTIARNKVLDHFRKARSMPWPADDVDAHGESALDNLPDGPQIDPRHIAQNRQLAAALLQAVQALPLPQRETFVLFAHEGLSLDEIARITCVEIETAKSRLRYARRTLRVRLASWQAD